MIVVSPHLDDALLSAAVLIREAEQSARVVTVFAGEPPAWPWPTPFDSLCGFRDSVDAVRARQAEDVAANGRASLCEPWHLPFRDGQYGIANDYAEVVTALMTYAGAMMAPLGLVHPDHVYVAHACREALRRTPAARSCWVYADLPSARLQPDTIKPALSLWTEAGWKVGRCLTRVLSDADVSWKDAVLAAYESQRRLPDLGIQNLNVESTWMLTRDD